MSACVRLAGGILAARQGSGEVVGLRLTIVLPAGGARTRPPAIAARGAWVDPGSPAEPEGRGMSASVPSITGMLAARQGAGGAAYFPDICGKWSIVHGPGAGGLVLAHRRSLKDVA